MIEVTLDPSRPVAHGVSWRQLPAPRLLPANAEGGPPSVPVPAPTIADVGKATGTPLKIVTRPIRQRRSLLSGSWCAGL